MRIVFKINTYYNYDMKFKKPSQYKAREDRTALSCRVKVSTKEYLEKQAQKANMSLAELVSQVIEDYSEFLKKGK